MFELYFEQTDGPDMGLSVSEAALGGAFRYRYAHRAQAVIESSKFLRALPDNIGGTITISSKIESDITYVVKAAGGVPMFVEYLSHARPHIEGPI